MLRRDMYLASYLARYLVYVETDWSPHFLSTTKP